MTRTSLALATTTDVRGRGTTDVVLVDIGDFSSVEVDSQPRRGGDEKGNESDERKSERAHFDGASCVFLELRGRCRSEQRCKLMKKGECV